MPEGLFTPTDCGPMQYCGPTAIAAVTGLSIAHVEDAVLAHRAVHGTPRKIRTPRGCRVKSMFAAEIVPVLERLGFDAVEHITTDHGGTTLRYITRLAREPLVVLLTGHFIALHGRMVVDSILPEPHEYTRRLRLKRWRAKRYWTVTRRAAR